MLSVGDVFKLSDEWKVRVFQGSDITLSYPNEALTRSQHSENDEKTAQLIASQGALSSKFFIVTEAQALPAPLDSQLEGIIFAQETDNNGNPLEQGLNTTFVLPTFRSTVNLSFADTFSESFDQLLPSSSAERADKNKATYFEALGIEIVGRRPIVFGEFKAA